LHAMLDSLISYNGKTYQIKQRHLAWRIEHEVIIKIGRNELLGRDMVQEVIFNKVRPHAPVLIEAEINQNWQKKCQLNVGNISDIHIISKKNKSLGKQNEFLKKDLYGQDLESVPVVSNPRKNLRKYDDDLGPKNDEPVCMDLPSEFFGGAIDSK